MLLRYINVNMPVPYSISKLYVLYKDMISNLRGKFDKSYYRVWNPWFLNKSQWFSEEEIKSLQLEGLKKLVEHARRNTIYYKNLPNIKSLEDLEKIPILTKKIIRGNFDGIRAMNVPGFKVTTSGTVSKSTTIKDNRLKFEFGFEFGSQRFVRWYKLGYPLRRLCRLWGYRTGGRYLYLPSSSLKTREDAINYLRLIEKFRPDLIIAYPSAMRFLAHYALEEGIQPEIRVIQTNGEILFPEVRKELEEVFQCDVYNQYSSVELGTMAQDCEIHGELHLNAERFIVEEVDGRLLFTDLLNYAMPLIRYENQDVGEFSKRKCNCGRGLPTLKSIIGRTFDYLLTKKDTWTSMYPLRRSIIDYDIFDWVEAFQFKQVEKGKVTVLLKPWFDSKKIPDFGTLTKIFYEKIPRDELDISIEIVDSLILSKSGKQIQTVTNFTPWNV